MTITLTYTKMTSLLFNEEGKDGKKAILKQVKNRNTHFGLEKHNYS